MRKKTVYLAFFLFLVVTSNSTATATSLSIGVQSGQYIEYNVTYTGTPIYEHNVVWARMDILSVQHPNVTVSITSEFDDGLIQKNNYTLNLETGHLIDNFIIPSNLTVGDNFIDENLGNITITSQNKQSYAGAERVILSSTIGNNTYVWDQKTGISVEGKSRTNEYEIHTVVSVTNMWQTTSVQIFDFTLLVIVIIGLLFIGLIIATLTRNRKKLK
ncbi:MAG: hypothetical protein GX799_06645 [Crenarchaeota archaeon]|jgi:hypothetical protein|nr:hypothetical protein [Thermoproteota archaeon]